LAVLEVSNLSKSFGGVDAVVDVSFHVEERSILGIIGPNGAGKSTVINLLTGLYRPLSGKVMYSGKDITGLSSHSVAQLGIGRTFQHTTSFPDMTALESVALAQIYLNKIGLWETLFRPSKVERWRAARLDNGYEALELVGLHDRANVKCKNLPHAEQVALDIAIAVATGARLLLLDEPAGGLNTSEIGRLMDVVRTLQDRGATIVMIEHHMALVMSICGRVVVLNDGRKIAEGSPKEIQENELVIDAYLGKDADRD